MQSRLETISHGFMEACWLAAAVLIPLFFSLSSIQIFESDKVAVLRFLALFAGAAWLLTRVGSARRESSEPSHSLLRNPLVKPVLALALIYLLSSLFSIVPSLSWWGLYRRAQGTFTFFSYVILFLIVVTELRRPIQLKRIQFVLVLTSIPVAAYPIMQKMGLDPLPQSHTLIERSSGTMGNPIFLGGYLIMIIPLTICLLTETVKKRESGLQRAPWLGLMSGFSVALILQFVALACTNSRGPVAGLAVAGYVIALVLFVLKRTPRKKTLVIPFAAAGLGFFAPLLILGVTRLVFKSPAGIVLAGLASAMAVAGIVYAFFYGSTSGRSWFWLTWLVQPLALILVFALFPSDGISSWVPPSLGRFSQLSGNSIGVRASLWESGVRYLQSGPPSVFPEGTHDRYHFLRFVIGYGPECAWLPANFYAVPSLLKLQPTQTADRTHNETFDNLFTIGFAGSVAFLVVVGAGLFCSLRLLGFTRDANGKKLFLMLSSLGALAGIAVPWMIGASYLAGTGVELGLLAGTVLFVAWNGFRQTCEPFESGPRQLLVLAILAGLIAHFVEAGVGIAVTPTRVYFYLFLALLSVLSAGKLGQQEMTSKTKRSKGVPEPSNWFRPYALVTAFAVLALSWGFTFNSTKEQSVWAVFGGSWLSGRWKGLPMPGALILVVLTIGGSLVFMLAERADAQGKGSIFRRRLILSGALLSGFWVLMSAVSAAFWMPSSSPIPVKIASEAESRFTLFLMVLFILLIIGALILSAQEKSRDVRSVRIQESLLAIGLFACAAIGTNRMALHPGWADIDCRVADFYQNTGDPASAAQIFARASSLVPHETAYQVSLGLAQSEAGVWDPRQMSKAAISFQHALDLNPMDPAICRAMGTFHMRTAEQLSDPAGRIRALQKALSYLKRASLLAPNFPDAYNEMGRCYFLMGEDEKANSLYQKALKISPSYSRTYMFLGEMHYRRKNYEEALKYFRLAVEVDSENIEAGKNVGFLLALLGHRAEAIRVNLDTLRMAPQDSVLLTRLAVLYFGGGDYNQGMEFARRAYDATPAPGKGSLDEFIEKLKLQGK
jgi:tetratricopeptide (TPR) repeat protein